LKILCLHYITLSLAIYAKLSSILLLFICAFQDGIYCPFSQLQRPSGHQTRRHDSSSLHGLNNPRIPSTSRTYHLTPSRVRRS
jgi:hypothetical protein